MHLIFKHQVLQVEANLVELVKYQLKLHTHDKQSEIVFLTSKEMLVTSNAFPDTSYLHVVVNGRAERSITTSFII